MYKGKHMTAYKKDCFERKLLDQSSIGLKMQSVNCVNYELFPFLSQHEFKVMAIHESKSDTSLLFIDLLLQHLPRDLQGSPGYIHLSTQLDLMNVHRTGVCTSYFFKIIHSIACLCQFNRCWTTRYGWPCV